MRSAMGDFFDRLLAKWERAGEGLPRAPWDQDVDARIWQGASVDGWAPWRPLEKTVRHDFAVLAPDLGPLHSSIDDYFNSWWFCQLEGVLDDDAVMLEAVLPGMELESFLDVARGYRDAHEGALRHVPIGVEAEGLQVVVDNASGEVSVEDWERGTFEPIAPSLSELIRRLEP